MLLAFALQAPRKLYAAYVHVNAVVETLVPSHVYQFYCSGSHVSCRSRASQAARLPLQSYESVSCNQRLRQHRSMKLVPVVEIVQVHCVFRGRSIIGHAACAQNTASRFVIMIVTAHGRVVFFDRVSI
jgi:hypothetical protein